MENFKSLKGMTHNKANILISIFFNLKGLNPLFKKFWTVIFLLIMFTGVSLANNLVLHKQSLIIDDTNSKTYGYIECQLLKTELGYCYKQHSAMTVDLLSELITVVNITEFDLDQDYAILKAYKQQLINEYETEIYLNVDYSSKMPTISTEIYSILGTKLSKPIKDSFTLSEEKLYFRDTAIYRILSTDGIIPGSEYEFQFIDLNNLAPYHDVIAIGETDHYSIDDQQIELHRVIYSEEIHLVNETGTIYKIIYDDTEPEIIIRPAKSSDSTSINALLINAYKSIPNLKIPHPQRCFHSLIRINGNNLNKYDFMDNRQQITEYLCFDGSDQILLEVSQDTSDYTGQMTLPIETDGLEKYLRRDSLIDPTLPQVQALVEQILEDDSDTWQASLKIMHWVWEYIEPDFQVKPVTTAEILNQKYGDVVEHVTLFAALARASGIPTRIAAGLRYSENLWQGWLWNEIWLGEWVAIDPSYLQSEPDALLIKLMSGSSIEELNGSAIKQFKELQLSIRLVESTSGPFTYNPELSTEIAGQTYTNADFCCSITLPDHWYFTDASANTFTAVDQSSAASVDFQLLNLHFPLSVQQIIDSQTYQLSKLPDITVYPPEEYQTRTISGYEAAVVKWGLELEDDRYLSYQEQWILIIDDQCYVITLVLPALLYTNFESDFAEIIHSFTIHN